MAVWYSLWSFGIFFGMFGPRKIWQTCLESLASRIVWVVGVAKLKITAPCFLRLQRVMSQDDVTCISGWLNLLEEKFFTLPTTKRKAREKNSLDVSTLFYNLDFFYFKKMSRRLGLVCAWEHMGREIESSRGGSLKSKVLNIST
jgi:hypothetical protein